jgi:glyoxylase-like metal-dependent hydrolase (beta-lactamase superfamily II)
MQTIHQLIVGPIATNCWIYQIDDTNAIVIDPGAEAELINSALKNKNLTVNYIVMTHGHFDHITALPQLASMLGNTEIAIHRLDAVLLERHKGGKMPLPTRLLEEGDTLGPLTVLHVPGHTPGSIALWDKNAGILFSGDTLFAGDWGRTDLPGGSEEQIFNSLRRLLSLAPETKVYPGHEETTTIGNEQGLI